MKATQQCTAQFTEYVKLTSPVPGYVPADYPLSTSMQVQASADQDVLSGQYSSAGNASANLAARNASFTGLLLHALPASYNITFSAINRPVRLSLIVLADAVCTSES